MSEPAPRRTPSALRRFFLMEQEIAAAREQIGGAGEPGTVEARNALGAREAALVFATRQRRLEYSDGSSAAYALFREAAWWTLRACLAREPGGAPVPVSAEKLWAAAMNTTAAQRLATLDPALVERARVAFVSRSWDIASLDDPTRLGELRALREVVERLLGPLEAGLARVTRLRILRAGRLVTAVLAVVLLVATLGQAWRAHRRGPNLALHKPTTPSSAFSGYEKSDGVVDGNTADLGFHTSQQDRPWLLLDLGSPTTIRQVVVHNREDCCKDRAVPLLVEVSLDGQQFREVARRDVEFTKWKVKLAPVETRYVRFTADKKTWLHLNEIEVYPGL